MKKKTRTSKTLISVASGHGAVIAIIALCSIGFNDSSKMTQQIHDIKALPSQSITSTVTSDQVDKTMDTFRALRAASIQKEIAQRQEIDDLKRESAIRSRSALAKKAELHDISRQIEKQRAKLESLRKKKLADLKRKKRLAEEKRAKDMAIAAQKIAERQRKIKEKVEKDKKVAAQRKQQAAFEKEAKQKQIDLQRQVEANARQNKIDRATYEGEIYDRLFGAWSLPYVREDVRCSVRLEVSRDGSINGFKFITPCPEMYKSSITTAINNTGRFEIKNPKTYHDHEVVNFMDNLSNQSVR